MPLKFSKLVRFLEKNKLVITTYYVWRDFCKYIRAFSIDTGVSFLISVNQDYHCTVDSENDNVCILEKIKFSSEGKSVIERFSTYPSENEVKSAYELGAMKTFHDSSDEETSQKDETKSRSPEDNSSDAEKERNPDKNSEKTSDDDATKSETEEEKLHLQYKKKIILQEVDSDAENKLKECVRQVKRLSFGLEDLKYSICIVDEKFFVTLETSDSPIETFFCKTQTTDKKRLFFLCISLENFYDRKQKAIKDVKEIRQAIFGLLDKNSEFNIQKLYAMFAQLDSMGGTVQQIFDTKTRLAGFIQSFQDILSDIITSEKEISQQLSSLLQEENDGTLNEVAFVYKKQNLNDKLSRITKLKQQILKNITSVMNENDNLYLKSDRCDFENIILLDAVIKNLKENEREISYIKS